MRLTKIISGTPDIDVFIRDWLVQLPQANQINKNDAARWYQETISNDPDRFAWHFKNLGRLSAIEAGEITQRSLGFNHRSLSLETIIKMKLMQIPVNSPTNIERRNILCEQAISTIFKSDFHAKPQHDVVKEIGSHRLGWMRDNIDDVVMISDVLAGLLYLGSKSDNNEVHIVDQCRLLIFDYLLADSRGQAHITMDELVKRTSPLAFDVLLNIHFDYDTGTTCPITVPYSGELMKAIIDANDYVWLNITKAQPLPLWPITDNSLKA